MVLRSTERAMLQSMAAGAGGDGHAHLPAAVPLAVELVGDRDGADALGQQLGDADLAALYGVLAEESIGRMFIAGLVPGILLAIGLAIFGFPFAVNSSLHSYLILAYESGPLSADVSVRQDRNSAQGQRYQTIGPGGVAGVLVSAHLVVLVRVHAAPIFATACSGTSCQVGRLRVS